MNEQPDVPVWKTKTAMGAYIVVIALAYRTIFKHDMPADARDAVVANADQIVDAVATLVGAVVVIVGRIKAARRATLS